MKKIFLLLFCLSMVFVSDAQWIKKDFFNDDKFKVSFTPSAHFSDIRSKDGKDKAIYYILDLRSYFFYNLHKNIDVGTTLSYDFSGGNFYSKKNFIEVGVSTRYVSPFFMDSKFLNQFRFYTGLEYYKTNYRYVSDIQKTIKYKELLSVNEDFIVSNKIDQTKIAVPLGFMFRLSNRFSIDFNYQYMKYIKGRDMTRYMLGIAYSIKKHDKTNSDSSLTTLIQ